MRSACIEENRLENVKTFFKSFIIILDTLKFIIYGNKANLLFEKKRDAHVTCTELLLVSAL